MGTASWRRESPETVVETSNVGWIRTPRARIAASAMLMLIALGWAAAIVWWLRDDPASRPWWFYVFLGVLSVVVLWLLARSIRNARHFPP